MANPLPTTLAQLQTYIGYATSYFNNYLVPSAANAYFTEPPECFMGDDNYYMYSIALDVLNNYLSYLPFPEAVCMLTKLPGWQNTISMTVTPVAATPTIIVPSHPSGPDPYDYTLTNYNFYQATILIDSIPYSNNSLLGVNSTTFLAWLNTLPPPGAFILISGPPDQYIAEPLHTYGNLTLQGYPAGYTITGSYPVILNSVTIGVTPYPVNRICYNINDVAAALNALAITLGYGTPFTVTNNTVNVPNNIYLVMSSDSFIPFY